MAAWGNLLPLIVLFVIVGGGGYIGYQVYLWSHELADRGKKKLEKKNMSFTKDGGLRVGVKELRDEDYADKTQNVLVNTWNKANSSKEHLKSSRSSSRPATARTASGPSTPRTGGGLQTPTQRGSAQRSASPLPGGWD